MSKFYTAAGLAALLTLAACGDDSANTSAPADTATPPAATEPATPPAGGGTTPPAGG